MQPAHSLLWHSSHGYRRWHAFRYHRHIHWLTVIMLLLSVGAGIWTTVIPSAVPLKAATGINAQLPFQGRLTNSDGTVVADGNYDVTFNLYSASSGGSATWTEAHTSSDHITTKNGVFSTVLGSITSLASFDFNSDTWYLGITVGSDSEMTPRIRLGAAPYAFNADKLDGIDSTSFGILGGQSGGQTLKGDTASGGNLTLMSTANATKGKILFGTSAYDEANNRLGIGTAIPGSALEVAGNVKINGTGRQLLVGSGANTGTTLDLDFGDVSTAGATFRLFRSTNTSGTRSFQIFKGDGSASIQTNLDSIGDGYINALGGNLGIGTASPGSALDVKGTFRLSGSTSGYVGFAPASAAGSTTYTLPSADGSNGQALQTNGSGTLSWGNAVNNLTNGGRLTLTTATPVTGDAGVTSATTVYFTPYIGNQISLYDGTNWANYTFSEISIKLTDTQTGSITNNSAVVTGLTDTSQFIVGMQVTGTGMQASTTILSIDSATQVTLNKTATATQSSSLTFKTAPNLPYDIFAFNNSGTVKLAMVVWTSKTARATTTVFQNGVYVKNGDATRRYIGTVYNGSTAGQTEDSLTKRFVYNYQNAVPRALRRLESTTHWDDHSTSLNQANSNTANQVEIVEGQAISPIRLNLAFGCYTTTSTPTSCTAGFGEDVTNAIVSGTAGTRTDSPNTMYSASTATLDKIPAIGYHFYAWIEVSGSGSVTLNWGGTEIGGGITGYWPG